MCSLVQKLGSKLRGVHAGKQSEEDGLCEGGTRRQTVRGGWIVAVKAVYVAEESEQCLSFEGVAPRTNRTVELFGGRHALPADGRDGTPCGRCGGRQTVELSVSPDVVYP